MSSGDDEQTWETVARALENAKRHRAAGENSEAAGWYRLAARVLLEEGDEDHAIEYARLAAELDESAPAARGGGDAGEAPSVLRGKSRPGGRADGTGKHKAQRAPETIEKRGRADTSGRNKAMRPDASPSRADGTGKHKAQRPSGSVSAAPPAPLAPAAKSSLSAPPPPKAAAPVLPPKPSPALAPRSVLPPRPNASPEASKPALPLSKPSASMPPPAAKPAPSAPVVASKPPAPALPSRPPPPMPASATSSTPSVTPPKPPSAAAPLPSAARPAAATERVSVVPPAPSRPATAAASTLSIPPPAPIAQRFDYVRARLRSVAAFDELTSDQLREIARQVPVVEFADGEVIFDAGAEPGPVYVITAGSATVDPDDGSDWTASLQEDELLGLVGAWFGDHRRVRARAKGPVEAFSIAPSLLRALGRESATLRAHVDRIVRRRVQQSLPALAPSLAAIDRGAAGKLVEQCEIIELDEGALVQMEGLAARAAYFVAAGEVELFGSDVPPKTVVRKGPGALVGIASLRDETPLRCTVRATRRTLVARLPRAVFVKLAEEHQTVRGLRDATVV